MEDKKDKIIIRAAEKKDLNGILLLMKKLHKNESEKYGNVLSLDWVNLYGKKIVGDCITDDGSFISVAESNGKVVAFLRGSLYRNEMMWKIGKGAEIYEIFIEEKFRDQRIGALLMEAFLGWCKTRKIDYILINVAARNAGAIKFYENFGFESNQIIMEKKIG
jgi:ribosomal protein S18 acetylase RimI-like enzyme